MATINSESHTVSVAKKPNIDVQDVSKPGIAAKNVRNSIGNNTNLSVILSIRKYPLLIKLCNLIIGPLTMRVIRMIITTRHNTPNYHRMKYLIYYKMLKRINKKLILIEFYRIIKQNKSIFIIF